MAARKDDVVKGAKKSSQAALRSKDRGSKDGAAKDGVETEPRPSRERPLAGPGTTSARPSSAVASRSTCGERRKARGMSLDDLARSSGVSRAALSQVETCKSNPTVGLLWKIAVGLGVPFAELIGDAATGATVLRRARRAGASVARRQAREPPALAGRRLAARRALRAPPRRPIDPRFGAARARDARAPRRPEGPAEDEVGEEVYELAPATRSPSRPIARTSTRTPAGRMLATTTSSCTSASVLRRFAKRALDERDSHDRL